MRTRCKSEESSSGNQGPRRLERAIIILTERVDQMQMSSNRGAGTVHLEMKSCLVRRSRIMLMVGGVSP